MPDELKVDLTPPAHATYDISKIIVAELILEELLSTFTLRQFKRIVDVLEVLDFKVAIKEDANA